MRPIPAQRIGHAHGLLKALEQRGKLRLEDFVTDFSEADLFPAGLDNGFGRARQFVSYARAAGLLKEERGAVELTDLGKRYVGSGDPGDVFAVSPGQAESLRRQLREKHLLDSIWNGLAIALSLYASMAEGDWVAAPDLGRSASHLGRVGWDNEQTFKSQGERLTHLLEDMELIGPDRRLTDLGRETLGELRLPEHPALKDLAAQLHPEGADGAALAASAEREELGLGPAPDAESAVAAMDPPPDASIEMPADDPPAEVRPAEVRPDHRPIAGPDDRTRAYPKLTIAEAGLAGSSVAEAAAPELPAHPTEETVMSDPVDFDSDSMPGFQSGIRPATAITALRPGDLENFKAAEEQKAEAHGADGPFLDPAEVRAAAERRGLVIDPGVYAAAIAALASGRHLVLTGGAGSGKTSLALAIAEAAERQGRCKAVLFTSASGLDAPDALTRAIGKNRWLVIDELDRVKLDEALGSVSTVLGGQAVDLPGTGELAPPAGWRMIATMAGIDQVAETTEALRRRFVFVEVPVLERADLETLVGAWAGGDETAASVGRRLVAVNDVVALGPALYRDAVSYVRSRRTLTDASEDDLTIEALAGFVLPQLEGQGDEVAARAVRAAGFEG